MEKAQKKNKKGDAHISIPSHACASLASKGVHPMSKILTTVTVAALLLVFNLGKPATAQFKGTPSGPATNAGMCPPGTCAQNGGQRARDLKMCAASNCKRPQAGTTKAK
jgi:hypothetical protein